MTSDLVDDDKLFSKVVAQFTSIPAVLESFHYSPSPPILGSLFWNPPPKIPSIVVCNDIPLWLFKWVFLITNDAE